MALNINGTTGISGVEGSVSAPVLTGTDSNCGISFPAADTIKFSTGGVERMSITNSGVTGTGIGGKIVQYVTSGALTASKVTSGSTELELTSQTITPASSSNKILILANANTFIYGSSNAYSGYRIYRGSLSGTEIYKQFGGLSANSYPYSPIAFNFIDSPNTTSSQQYTFAMSRSSGNTDRLETDGQSYSLTLIELEP